VVSERCDFGHVLGTGGPCGVCDDLRARGVAVATYPPFENGHRPTATTPTAYKEVGVGLTLRLVSLASLRQRHSGDVDWIVDGYFACGEVVFIAGAGESLKSWAAAHLAAAVDGAFPWLGAFPVKAERVLFFEQERAANLVYQLNRIEIAERVTLGSDRLRIVEPTTLPLSEIEYQTALRMAVMEFRPNIIVINALRDVLGRANENSPTDMAALLRSLGRVAEEFRCCVVIIDHFNKAGLSGLVRGNSAHSGTAQKHAEADAVWIFERSRDDIGRGIGPATVSAGKRRSGEAGDPFAVSVTDTPDGGVLVHAEKGVTALSPVARALYLVLESGEAQVAELVERTGKRQELIYKALSELKAAGLIDNEGPMGKKKIYWRRDIERTTTPTTYKAEGVVSSNGHLAKYAVEQLGLEVRRD
jgi:AAA domain